MPDGKRLEALLLSGNILVGEVPQVFQECCKLDPAVALQTFRDRHAYWRAAGVRASLSLRLGRRSILRLVRLRILELEAREA